MDHLIERIRALPAELFDEIRALTFTADAEEVVEITPGYMPPVQLQVNHATRESFARAYYTSVPFLIIEENATFGIKWLNSLGPKTCNYPKTLQIGAIRNNPPSNLVCYIQVHSECFFCKVVVIPGHTTTIKMEKASLTYGERLQVSHCLEEVHPISECLVQLSSPPSLSEIEGSHTGGSSVESN